MLNQLRVRLRRCERSLQQCAVPSSLWSYLSTGPRLIDRQPVRHAQLLTQCCFCVHVIQLVCGQSLWQPHTPRGTSLLSCLCDASPRHARRCTSARTRSLIDTHSTRCDTTRTQTCPQVHATSAKCAGARAAGTPHLAHRCILDPFGTADLVNELAALDLVRERHPHTTARRP